jgi:hypothetical protein
MEALDKAIRWLKHLHSQGAVPSAEYRDILNQLEQARAELGTAWELCKLR